jgi:hypothetical protein
MIETTEGLAIHEGPKAVALAPPNWLHCTNEIAEVEIRAVTGIVSSKVLFRYAGDPANSSVSRFEARFGAVTGSKQVRRGIGSSKGFGACGHFHVHAQSRSPNQNA